LVGWKINLTSVSYTHLRAHETVLDLVCRLLLEKNKFDPKWVTIMIAVNLQTSFLTPPFGFALFYLRGVAPKSITTGQIYRGVMPFIGIQVLGLMVLAFFPGVVTIVPNLLN